MLHIEYQSTKDSVEVLHIEYQSTKDSVEVLHIEYQSTKDSVSKCYILNIKVLRTVCRSAHKGPLNLVIRN